MVSPITSPNQQQQSQANLQSTAANNPRLLVIANRLPISLSSKTDKKTGKTTLATQRSSGGLVSALQGLSNNPNVNPEKASSGFSMKWIGWPGMYMSLYGDHITI